MTEIYDRPLCRFLVPEGITMITIKSTDGQFVEHVSVIAGQVIAAWQTVTDNAITGLKVVLLVCVCGRVV